MKLSTLRYVCALSGVLFALSGCSSGGGSSDGSSSSGAVANISGSVSQTSGSSSKLGHRKVSAFSQVGKFAESGCSVQARDIETNDVVATATSDSNGNYTLTGVDSGTTYKVVATCGSNVYAVVATAVTSDPDEISDEDRVATDPRSTIIAAYVVQAILSAVDEATTGLPASVQNTVKAAILQQLDAIVQTITSTIQEAISSGSMDEPTVADAAAVGGALKTADDITDIDNAVAAAPPAPVAVEQAVLGAKSSASAMQACDSGAQGTVASCTRAVAKMMYNVLGFPVGIIKGGGAFGIANSCLATTTVTGGGTLGDYFPNADFISGTGGNDIPADYCAIIPKVAAPDRNRGYENGGKDDNPVFVEEGDLDGDNIDDTGVLTELAKAMIGGKRYNLASVDKMVFGSSVNGAGFNARLVARIFTAAAGTGSRSFAYYGASGWTNTGWENSCSEGGWGENTGSTPCSWWSMNIDFTNTQWSSATAHPTLASAISAGNVAGLGVMLKKFGGPVPAQNELDSYIDQDKVHRDYNISGEKEIQVVLASEPSYENSNGSNPCWDQDPSTACVDINGAAVSGKRLNMTLGSADPTTKIKPITGVTGSNTGEYYMRPYWSQSGFSGVIGFIKVADGRIARDEMMRDRAIKIVLHTGECGDNNIPGGCQEGELYNVELDWSSCNGGGGDCPAYSVTDTTPIAKTSFSVSVNSNYKTQFEQSCNGSGCVGHQLVGVGDWNSLSYFKFSITVDNSGRDTLVLSGSGKASASGEYNIALAYDCSGMGPCSLSGFYLVDKDGVPHSDETGDNFDMGHPGGTWTDVGRYTVAEVDAAGDFDSGTGATDGIEVAVNYGITSGPIRNPNFDCEKEPFFVDGNGNGVLDCAVVGGYSQAASGDKSFSGTWEYSNWLNDPSVSQSVRDGRALQYMRPRDNAYVFGDPVGTKKLMSTAFNGWFDGKHTLAASTSLDGLQAFAMLYLFMSSGGDTQRIEGIHPQTKEFEMISPMFGDGGMDVLLMNKSIGKSFGDFKTN